jgi:DNA-binding transcriptional MerR regulator
MNKLLKIALVLLVLFALFLVIKEPIKNYIQSDSIRIIQNKILSEEKNLSNYYNTFNREDSLLWTDFSFNLQFQYDVNMNIHKIEKAIESNKTKDSISLKTFNNIKNLLKDFEHEYPSGVDGVNLTNELLVNVIKSYKQYSAATIKRYEALINYHKTIFDKPEVSNHFLDIYKTAEFNYFKKRKSYFSIYQSFINGLQNISDSYKPY